MSAVVGVDAGGTAIKAAVYDGGWTAVAQARMPTPRPPTADSVLDAVARIVSEVCRDGRVEGGPIGVAIPGIVDEDAGEVRLATNLALRDTPVRDLLRARTGTEIAVVNDAWAACRAEWLLGAARGVEDVLMVTLGTGIGGAAVARGARIRGASWGAGEIGHIVVDPEGDPCGCGGRGCLETLASARAVGRRYAAAAAAGEHVEASAVVALAAAGDPYAVAVWSQAVRALAAALATCVTLLDPELVVIGGGMAEAGDALLDPLREALGGLLTLRRPPRVVAAVHGAAAGRLGAALSAVAGEL